MPFWIQAANPRTTGDKDHEDSTLDDALEHVFPMRTETAILHWNYLPIVLNYQLDVSAITPDLVTLLTLMRAKPLAGQHRVTWPSSTFRATWKLSWDSENVTIDADWQAVVGDLESALNQRPSVTLERERFIAEWKPVLGHVVHALQISGYEAAQLAGMQALLDLYPSLTRAGWLYDSDWTL